MKYPLIQLTPDKVTISEEGRAASKKWKAGDTPFVHILEETRNKAENAETVKNGLENIEIISEIDDDSEGMYRFSESHLPQKGGSADVLILDIGSRLEIDDLPKMKNFTIRSITRVTTKDGQKICETVWEVRPEKE